MSEPKLISPMLDSFMMGDPIGEHHGVRSCPAMDQVTEDKYIVKIISTPSTPQKLDALLLSGAFETKEAALAYFEDLTNGIVHEIKVLEKLSSLEGFVAFDKYQVVPMEDGNGFDVYILGSYKRSLSRLFEKEPLTHLSALNLGLDLCSALSACRHNGYLYVDLKPENIYRTKDGNFRIGDIGFQKLDSLKYASLPERYISAYTAPEVTDAFSALNSTLDIYALGLILYQVFNGGNLPNLADPATLPAPDYADYEMAEIILKACSACPEDRWQDPVEMGQAIVSYMQRNGAHDTPIVPAVLTSVTETPIETSEEISEEIPASTESIENNTVDVVCNAEELPADTLTAKVIESVEQALSGDAASAEVYTETPIETDVLPQPASSDYAEDSFGNLSFLDEDDETLPGTDPSDIEYGQVSVEISDMLSQVDELVAHPTPAPVVAPDPISVEIPAEETIIDDETAVLNKEIATAVSAIQEDLEEDTTAPSPFITAETDSSEDSSSEDVTPVVAVAEGDLDDDMTDNLDEDSKDFQEEHPKKSRWLGYVIAAVIILGLLAGAYFYYTNYYLLHVNSIRLEGNETVLTVYVESTVDESKLVVVCSDTYGNQRIEPILNGKAVFKDLAPDSAYTVKLQVDNGFHKLTGNTSHAYTTPVQTKITNFNAITGQTDGSVILKFTADGPSADQWNIAYTTEGEETRNITFTGNICEISELTVGKEYTFLLTPVDDLFYIGDTELSYVASNLIYAEELLVTNCANGNLTVKWSAPDGIQVSNWTVHCYNEKGFDETIVTEESTASFEGIEDNTGYNIEVSADGMSVSQRTYIAPDAVCVTDFTLTLDSALNPTLTWNYAGDIAQTWLIATTADGVTLDEIKVKSGNSAKLPPLVPGATYKFTLKTADGTNVIGGMFDYIAADADEFNAYNIDASKIKLKMCKTPSKKNWDRYDVRSSDYTTTFEVGEKASLLLHLTKKQKSSSDSITTHLVIKNEQGQIVSTAHSTTRWKSMWEDRYSTFNLKKMPTTPGKYTLDVYFNGALAANESFTITE